MTIKDLDVKQIIEVETMLDFFTKFDLVEAVKKKYDIADIDDIYSLGLCDQEEITEWLEESDRDFTMDYVDDRKNDYFVITEYN
jgi:hypothetical protein